jgi:hypothetical protein
MRRILETTALAGRCEAEIIPGTVTEKVGFLRRLAMASAQPGGM